MSIIWELIGQLARWRSCQWRWFFLVVVGSIPDSSLGAIGLCIYLSILNVCVHVSRKKYTRVCVCMFKILLLNIIMYIYLCTYTFTTIYNERNCNSINNSTYNSTLGTDYRVYINWILIRYHSFSISIQCYWNTFWVFI